MKQIAIISGKGGTGKTSISAAIISVLKDVILADCDVDAPDLHIIFEPKIVREEKFLGSLVAEINQDKCNQCNKCYEVCRFDAIDIVDGKYYVNEYNCDGCGFCFRVCDVDAIKMSQNDAGDWFIGETRYGKFVYALLEPGEENSGKLVTMVRHQARLLAQQENKDYVIIDGPPGIGCPVISTLSGVDMAIVVTEPTQSGLHDMKRIIQTAEHFKVPSKVLINKFNLNEKVSEEIEEYCKSNGYEVLGKVPFDKSFVLAMMDAKTIIEYNPELEVSKIIIDIVDKVKKSL